jgi:hypothetical protein
VAAPLRACHCVHDRAEETTPCLRPWASYILHVFFGISRSSLGTTATLLCSRFSGFLRVNGFTQALVFLCSMRAFGWLTFRCFFFPPGPVEHV